MTPRRGFSIPFILSYFPIYIPVCFRPWWARTAGPVYINIGCTDFLPQSTLSLLYLSSTVFNSHDLPRTDTFSPFMSGQFIHCLSELTVLGYTAVWSNFIHNTHTNLFRKDFPKKPMTHFISQLVANCFYVTADKRNEYWTSVTSFGSKGLFPYLQQSHYMPYWEGSKSVPPVTLGSYENIKFMCWTCVFIFGMNIHI